MSIKVKGPLDAKKTLLQERRWKRAIRKIEGVVPFWAYHAERLQLVMCRGWNNTAAVDGINLFWNPEFTASLSDKQLLFLLVHEVFHVAAGHIWRGQRYFQGLTGIDLHRMAGLWNKAADYVIHSVVVPLIDSGEYSELEFIPSGLYDAKYAGKSVETVFGRLKAESEKEREEGPGEPCENGTPGLGGSNGSGSGDGESDKSAPSSGTPGKSKARKRKPDESGSGEVVSGEAVSGEGSGSDSSGTQKVIDVHIIRGEGEVPEGATQGDDDSWVMIIDAEGNPIQPGADDPKPEPMDPRGLRRQIQRDINDAKLEAANDQVAKINGRGHGKGGKGKVEKIDPAAASKQSWDILKKFILQCANADYSYARPNKSYLSRGLIIPGLRSSALKIKVAIDTSSSIDKTLLNRFASEVEGIRSQLGDHEIELITCSTYIPTDSFKQKQTQIVRTGEDINWNIEIGGGTEFWPVFDYVGEQGDAPACLLYFTDLDGGFPKYQPEYPVLWAVPHDCLLSAPFGEVIKLNAV